jgi:hypothetical protein
MLQRYAMQSVQAGGQQEVQEGFRFQRKNSQAAFPRLLIGRKGPGKERNNASPRVKHFARIP